MKDIDHMKVGDKYEYTWSLEDEMFGLFTFYLSGTIVMLRTGTADIIRIAR